jgi:hypothetical protein
MVELIKTNMLALVRDEGGVTLGQTVVVGTDHDALDGLGAEWVQERGGEAGYNDYSIAPVELLPNGGPNPASILADIIAWSEEAVAGADGRSLEQDLADFRAIARHARRAILPAVPRDGTLDKLITAMRAGQVTVTEAAHRLELLLHRAACDLQAVRAYPAEDLAREAVDMMGDIFYDADQHAEETLPCARCEREVQVGSKACPHCGLVFDGPLSKNRWIREEAVRCVAWAIHAALRQAVETPCGDCGERGDCPFAGYLSSCDDWRLDVHPRLEPLPQPDDEGLRLHARDFELLIGDFALAQIRVVPRKFPLAFRRTRSDQAVEFVLYRPGGGCDWQATSLQVAREYLRRLGIDPTPLWEKAREKGWEVQR